MLHELDENLVKATSAREALGMLLRMDFAVVLLDVSMPEIDGFELAGMIRQHPRFHKQQLSSWSALLIYRPRSTQGYETAPQIYVSVPVVQNCCAQRSASLLSYIERQRRMDDLNAQLQHVSSRLMRVQDEERRRIARELHDGLGQELSAIKMMLARIVEENSASTKDNLALEGIDVVIARSGRFARCSYLLHPPLLDEVRIGLGLRCYLDGVTKRSRIDISLDIEPRQFPRLPRNVETAIFRIIQEALTNVFRHSKASKSWVVLSHEEKRLVVMVRDDGKGLPEDVVELRTGSVESVLKG